MVKSPTVKIYVEGGGDRKPLRTACRRGFETFLRKAGFADHMPAIVACGSRRQAYDRFCTATAQRTADFVCLLVDSEGPMTAATPWAHLAQRDGWRPPAGTTDKNAHLMVQMMESWFLADRACVERYFRQGFNENALPVRQRRVEDIAKTDLEKALRDSTRTSRKGRYDKGRDSFKLLGELDAAKVVDACPYARRLVTTIAGELGVVVP